MSARQLDQCLLPKGLCLSATPLARVSQMSADDAEPALEHDSCHHMPLQTCQLLAMSADLTSRFLVDRSFNSHLLCAKACSSSFCWEEAEHSRHSSPWVDDGWPAHQGVSLLHPNDEIGMTLAQVDAWCMTTA